MAEIELKLAVPAVALVRLRGRLRPLGVPLVQQLDTAYFDTPERLLASQGIALRLRRQGRQWLQTLKAGATDAALSTRAEWEVPAAAQALDVQRLPQAARKALTQAGLNAQQAQALQRWFRTRFRRTAWLVEHDGAQIEVALDEGEIIAGKRRAPLLELELELKAGAPAALLSLALQLVAPPRAAPLPLVPLPQSKAERGARLAEGAAPVLAKAQARRISAGLKPSMNAAAALRCLLRNGLAVLLANASGIVDADDAEFVHQARVALRRMRSAVRLLGRDADLPPALVEEMHWIAGALGPARDADVLVADTLPPLLAQLPSQPALLQAEGQALLAAAKARQQAARAAARAALRSARFGVFALRLMQWCDAPVKAPAKETKLAKGEKALKAMKAETQAASLTALAPRRLQRAQQRLIEAAVFFCALAPAERHRVRILAKRLRYAIDLFACALPERRTAVYVAALSELQEDLGRLNDAAVALHDLPQLVSAGALLTAIGAELQAQHASAEALVRTERQLAALDKMVAPWNKKSGERRGRRAA
jgi:inorganic triphosphatase YgiF